MGREVGRLTEALVAVVAAVRLLPGVGAEVSLECGRPRVRLAADPAEVGARGGAPLGFGPLLVVGEHRRILGLVPRRAAAPTHLHSNSYSS